MASHKFKHKAVQEKFDIFTEKFISIETFLQLLNKLECFFAKKGSTIYKTNSDPYHIFILSSGKAKVGICMDITNQKKIPTVFFLYKKPKRECISMKLRRITKFCMGQLTMKHLQCLVIAAGYWDYKEKNALQRKLIVFFLH